MNYPESRSSAKIAGALHYATGRPCKYGHIALRLTSTGNCTECARASYEDKKKYYRRDREEILRKCKAYREAKKDILRVTKKDYRERNKEKIAAQKARWCARNKAHISEKSKNYRAENPDKVKAYSARKVEARKSRRMVDPIYSLGCRIRCLVRSCIRARGMTKSWKTEDILGCTIAEFVSHIERQFAKGMTWENRSEWHIDHIVPMASAKTEEDVLRLNHFTNLRPLWAIDNLKKSNSAIFLL